MTRVVIIGAGISGLSLAYRLQQAGAQREITVLEKADRPGGTVWTEERQGFRVEVGPNGFLTGNSSTLTLCDELGIKDQLMAASEAASRHRYLFLGDRLKRLPASLPALLTSDLLSWRGKLNLFAERFRKPRTDDADESVAAFAERRAGREVAEVFADALVTGIYAGDPALLSVRSSFPRVAQLERAHGSILKGLARSAQADSSASARGPAGSSRQMWSFASGMRLLIDTLVGRLHRPPQLGVNVSRIEENGSSAGGSPRWTVHADGLQWQADAVVLTCPAYQQAALLADVDSRLADLVGGIAYNRLAVVALGYRRTDVPGGLQGFGYIAPQRARRDVLGVQWCSSIFPDRAPEGMVLLRAMCGGWHRADVVSWDDERLVNAVRSDLRAAMAIEREPCFAHVVRWDRAIPQYLLGHRDRVTQIEEAASRHPGLFLGGNAYRGVALNDCTEQAGLLARRVHGHLAASSR